MSKRGPTKIPLVKGTAHGNSLLVQKSGKYLYQFCTRPFEEEEEEEEEEKEEEEEEEKEDRKKFFFVIVAVYFTTSESLIVYRNTRRPCYVSKRTYSCYGQKFCVC